MIDINQNNIIEKAPVIALILAGGVGLRISEECPKQYLEFHGESILHHTLRAFCGFVDEVLIVCRDEWRDRVMQMTSDLPLTCKTCTAGNTGYESLCHGIAALDDVDASAYIMIHDAVRPLVSPDVIKDNLAVARRLGNSITSVATYETLLYAPEGDGTVRGMTRREDIFRAQTPQTFTLGTLRQMLRDARRLCIGDAQSACTLAHQLGYELHLSQGDLRNFKITTLSDLELYEALNS